MFAEVRSLLESATQKTHAYATIAHLFNKTKLRLVSSSNSTLRGMLLLFTRPMARKVDTAARLSTRRERVYHVYAKVLYAGVLA